MAPILQCKKGVNERKMTKIMKMRVHSYERQKKKSHLVYGI